MRAHFRRLWASYERANAARPLLVRGGVGSLIYVAGDVLAQKYAASRRAPPPAATTATAGATHTTGDAGAIDAERTARVASWRALFHSPFIHFFYLGLDALIPRLRLTAKAAEVAAKIAIDQAVALPVSTFVFIGWQSLLERDTWFQWAPAKERIEKQSLPAMKTQIAWWLPVHVLTYGVVPLRHRLVWVSFAGVIGGAILSNAAYDGDDDDDDAAAPPPDA